MPFDVVVRGGLVVSHDGTSAVDIGIRGGRVASVGAQLQEGDTEIDATGLVVMPGLVDVHVHLREPGMTEKEGFAHGTRAAAAGGVTTVVDMPNTVPAVATAAIFKEKLGIVGPKAHVDFGLYGLLGEANAAEIAPMAQCGALGLKLFMGHGGDISALLVDLLGLDAIVLGSAAQYLGPPWVEAVNAVVRREALPQNVARCTIRGSTLAALQDLSGLAAALYPV